MWAVSVGEGTAKKSVGQAPLKQRHAVIEHACEEKQPISIRHLCELLQVNRAWYYAKQHVQVSPSKRAEEVALRDAIEKIILDFSGYGYRRVTHALRRDGWKVNHKHVLRIMREESLLCHVNCVCQDTAGEPLPEKYTGKKTSARIARNASLK